MSNDQRGLSFGSVAEQYDRYRPSPPPEAVGILGAVAGLDVLEVGAGTGLWTRFLLSLGANVTVVEPDDQMRAVLQRRSPSVRALRGAAEQLPVDDESYDTVLVSSAWHWFTQPEATAEVARVLRDGGALYVLWNSFDRRVGWLSSLARLRERDDRSNPRPRGHVAEFDVDGPFCDVTQIALDWTRVMTTDELVGLFATFSEAIIQENEERRRVEVELRRRLTLHSPGGTLEVPMSLRGTVARRRAR